MAVPVVDRQILTDGTVRLRSGDCTFTFRRLRPGAVLVTIDGYDHGQFGPATVDEVAAEFSRAPGAMRLYVDTRMASGPTSAVMETWTAWLATNRSRLASVMVLVPPESKLLHLTVSIAQHLSRTGDLLRICGDGTEFERAVAMDTLR